MDISFINDDTEIFIYAEHEYLFCDVLLTRLIKERRLWNHKSWYSQQFELAKGYLTLIGELTGKNLDLPNEDVVVLMKVGTYYRVWIDGKIISEGYKMNKFQELKNDCDTKFKREVLPES